GCVAAATARGWLSSRTGSSGPARRSRCWPTTRHTTGRFCENWAPSVARDTRVGRLLETRGESWTIRAAARRMRVMLIPLSRPLVAAFSMLVLVSGSGATAAARPIDVTVSLKPRNASLLAYSARTSSGSKPMTTAQLRTLFAPTPADRAAVVAYMRGHGLHLERSGLL